MAGRGFQSRLARAMGCQAAYLYQVLNGKVHLTEDQGYLLVKHLGLSEHDWEYFSLLMRSAKASSKDLKSYFRKRCDEIRRVAMDLSQRADAPSIGKEEGSWPHFLSSTIPSAIHILTSSKHYQNSGAISKRLGISEDKTERHLLQLLQEKFVTRVGDKWMHQGASIHFPSSSPQNLLLQMMRRLQCLHSLQKERDEKNLHFSTLFTLDQETYSQLRSDLAHFIEKAQRKIHQGGSDEMYVMCLDLFEPDA